MPTPQGFNIFNDIIQLIQDEGIDLPFQPTINFKGTGVTATEDLGNSRIDVDIPGNVQPHDLLDGSQNQDTVANPATFGDLIIGNASPLWDVLGIGSVGQVLTVVAGAPAWATLPADVDFYQTIEDEGIALAQQPTFNFIGTGVTAVDNPGSNRTDITIPGNVQPHDLLDGSQNQDTVANVVARGDLITGNASPLWDVLSLGTSLQQLRVNAGGTDLEYFTPAPDVDFYQTIEDEGIALAQQPTFNFIGANVTAVDNPGSNRTDITITGGAGTGRFVLGYQLRDRNWDAGTSFGSFFGDDRPDGTEAKYPFALTFASTLKGYGVSIGINTSNLVSTSTFRLNGADVVSSTVTIPISTTGFFTSGVITQAIAIGDNINFENNRPGGGTVEDYSIVAEMLS